MERFEPGRVHVERWIRAAVATGAGLDPAVVIPAPGDGPRPDGAYGAVRLLSLAPSDPEASYGETADAGTLDRADAVAVRAVYGVTFYRAGSIDRAARCRTYLAGPGDHALRGRGGVDRRRDGGCASTRGDRRALARRGRLATDRELRATAGDQRGGG